VWLGIDLRDGKQVAWNTVDLNRIPEEQRKKIDSETEILVKLKHPHIIDIYDQWHNHEKNTICFVTEKCDDTLEGQIEKVHPAKIELIKKYCRQILLALQYLHSQKPPIIHRDIKVQNIFIGKQGDIKLGDFGLSIQTDRAVSMLGTPGHVAPEIFSEKYTHLVDIWSFGITVMEMTLNTRCYGKQLSNLPEMFQSGIKGEKPPELAQIKNHELRSFIELCLVPEDRRPDAAQLLEQKIFDLTPPFTSEPASRATSPIPVLTDFKSKEEPVHSPKIDSETGIQPSDISIEIESASNSGLSLVLTVHAVIGDAKEKSPTVRNFPEYKFDRDNHISVSKHFCGELPELKLAHSLELVIAQKIQDKVRGPYESWLKLKRATDVTSLLTRLEIDLKYAESFQKHQVSVADLPLLSETDLVAIIDAIGPRRRLQKHIEDMRNEAQKSRQSFSGGTSYSGSFVMSNGMSYVPSGPPLMGSTIFPPNSNPSFPHPMSGGLTPTPGHPMSGGLTSTPGHPMSGGLTPTPGHPMSGSMTPTPGLLPPGTYVPNGVSLPGFSPSYSLPTSPTGGIISPPPPGSGTISPVSPLLPPGLSSTGSIPMGTNPMLVNPGGSSTLPLVTSTPIPTGSLC
jgi:WNK lysine deficient protein kinase